MKTNFPVFQKLFVPYAVVTAVALLLAVLSWNVFRESEEVVRLIKQSNEMLVQVGKIRESTLVIESLTRGYLITGDKKPYAQRVKVVQEREAAFKILNELMADSAEHQAQMVALRSAANQRRVLADRAIELFETQGFEAARAQSMAAPVAQTREQFFKVLDDISEEKNELLRQRTEQHQQATNTTVRIFWTTLLLSFGLLLVVFILIRQQTGVRKAQYALERENHALEAAKAAAEKANIEKDNFLATMSHEIRTPMSGLLGMLELMAHSRLDMEQHETLTVARDSGRSLVRIIDDILDYEKIQAGKLDLLPEPVSLAQLLGRVRATYSVLARDKGLVLHNRADPRISPALMIDPLRLGQVLGNLVSNAIKFSQQGVVELNAEWVSTEAGFETVRFWVKDRGIGMTPEAQARVFQPYEQAGAETARLFGGTGLGLAISRKLTELMGGDLSIESTPGQGTTISLTLKLAVAEAVAQGAARQPEPVASTGQAQTPYTPPTESSHRSAPDHRAPWVLAVDDNPTSRLLIERQLSLLGMRVRTAENGVEAFALWQGGEFALVITDSNMPEMNGYDLTRMIRASEAALGRARTPVLGWTANAMLLTRTRCKEAGMDDVLVKPADMGQLRALLAKWLPPECVAAAPTQALDIKQMQEAFGGENGNLTSLLPSIRSSFSANLTEMRSTLQDGDLAAIQAHSHKMAGSAGLIGAQALMDVCQRIEALTQGEAEAALPALSRLYTAEAQRTMQALEDMG